jgi:hypothetical protein
MALGAFEAFMDVFLVRRQAPNGRDDTVSGV